MRYTGAMVQTPPAKKPAASSQQEKKVPVSVRVAESFRRRVQSECVRRDMSLQELVVAALRFYFRTPTDWDYAATTFIRRGEEDEELLEEEAAKRNAWLGLWVKYTDLMPEEKIEVMTRAMEWDLRAQKSARRKSARPRSGMVAREE